jgi:hypothetical protein
VPSLGPFPPLPVPSPGPFPLPKIIVSFPRKLFAAIDESVAINTANPTTRHTTAVTLIFFMLSNPFQKEISVNQTISNDSQRAFVTVTFTVRKGYKIFYCHAPLFEKQPQFKKH